MTETTTQLDKMMQIHEVTFTEEFPKLAPLMRKMSALDTVGILMTISFQAAQEGHKEIESKQKDAVRQIVEAFAGLIAARQGDTDFDNVLGVTTPCATIQ